MSYLHSARVSARENDAYATREDFEQLFVEQRTELLRYSLQLTGDAQKAEGCLNRAMRDCASESGVIKERVQYWARRVIMRHAIRVTWGTANDILCNPSFEFHLQPSRYSTEALRESVAIFGLPVLERLTFVICVLERYSIIDCALLLRQTPQGVRQAILRAIELLPIEERPLVKNGFKQAGGTIAGVIPHEGSLFAISCGSILDHDCR